MSYIEKYIRNLLVFLLTIVGLAIFTKLYYPDVWAILPLFATGFSLLKLWPLLVLWILAGLLPHRRHS